MVPQNQKTEGTKITVTTILRCEVNNLTIQLDLSMLYFDQEEVLVPALLGATPGFELSPS